MKKTFTCVCLTIQGFLVFGFIVYLISIVPLNWKWGTGINVPVVDSINGNYMLEVPSFSLNTAKSSKNVDKSYIDYSLLCISRLYFTQHKNTTVLNYEIVNQTNDFFLYKINGGADTPAWTIAVSVPLHGEAEFAVIAQEGT